MNHQPTATEPDAAIVEMVEKFQCPGCVLGYCTGCGDFNYDEREMRCTSHCLGTAIGAPNNLVALGLPRGFNKPGWNGDDVRSTIDIRLWPDGTHPAWDRLNVPVWAMEQDGYLFVRTFAPRVNLSWVDVIKDRTIALVPQAIDVKEFIDEID